MPSRHGKGLPIADGRPWEQASDDRKRPSRPRGSSRRSVNLHWNSSPFPWHPRDQWDPPASKGRIGSSTKRRHRIRGQGRQGHSPQCSLPRRGLARSSGCDGWRITDSWAVVTTSFMKTRQFSYLIHTVFVKYNLWPLRWAARRHRSRREGTVRTDWQGTQAVDKLSPRKGLDGL